MNADRCTVWDHLRIGEGMTADYAAMKAFHYRSGRPGGVKRVFVAQYCGPGLGLESAMPRAVADGGLLGSANSGGMVAGVIVEALPSLGCALRSVALPGRFCCGDRRLDAAKLNRDVRTISRVVVHPIFRSVGLAVELVRHVLNRAETPYVEALAAMGRVNRFFERAGMRAFDRPALPDVIRMIAALEREGLRPIDLADVERVVRSEFLVSELRRFARADGAFEELLAIARKRLLSQPVYYLWGRMGE